MTPLLKAVWAFLAWNSLQSVWTRCARTTHAPAAAGLPAGAGLFLWRGPFRRSLWLLWLNFMFSNSKKLGIWTSWKVLGFYDSVVCVVSMNDWKKKKKTTSEQGSQIRRCLFLIHQQLSPFSGSRGIGGQKWRQLPSLTDASPGLRPSPVRVRAQAPRQERSTTALPHGPCATWNLRWVAVNKHNLTRDPWWEWWDSSRGISRWTNLFMSLKGQKHEWIIFKLSNHLWDARLFFKQGLHKTEVVFVCLYNSSSTKHLLRGPVRQVLG